MELENLSFWCQGSDSSGDPIENLSTNTEHRGGSARSSDEVSVMEMEQRG